MIGADCFTRVARKLARTQQAATTESKAYLQDGWVLANHILVSFHAAFISSVLVLPSLDVSKGEVLQFIFVSPETVLSAIFVYITFHVGIAIHEIGHFMTAARLNALNDSIAEEVKANLQRRGVSRWLYLVKLFALAPWGRATGIKKQGLNYYPDAPFNLAVAAAGPRASRNLSLVTLPPAILLLGVGLWLSVIPAIYVGRLLLGIGIVAGLDFGLADAHETKIWFGILLIILLEAALITPPIGVNLYVVQGVRGKGAMMDVIVGSLPFVITMFVMIGLIMAFPGIALWATRLF